MELQSIHSFVLLPQADKLTRTARVQLATKHDCCSHPLKIFWVDSNIWSQQPTWVHWPIHWRHIPAAISQYIPSNVDVPSSCRFLFSVTNDIGHMHFWNAILDRSKSEHSNVRIGVIPRKTQYNTILLILPKIRCTLLLSCYDVWLNRGNFHVSFPHLSITWYE